MRSNIWFAAWPYYFRINNHSLRSLETRHHDPQRLTRYLDKKWWPKLQNVKISLTPRKLLGILPKFNHLFFVICDLWSLQFSKDSSFCFCIILHSATITNQYRLKCIPIHLVILNTRCLNSIFCIEMDLRPVLSQHSFQDVLEARCSMLNLSLEDRPSIHSWDTLDLKSLVLTAPTQATYWPLRYFCSVNAKIGCLCVSPHLPIRY